MNFHVEHEGKWGRMVLKGMTTLCVKDRGIIRGILAKGVEQFGVKWTKSGVKWPFSVVEWTKCKWLWNGFW